MCFRVVSLLISMCCFGFIAFAQDKNLEITGTVIGRERLFGHIYDANAVNKKVLIVRVDDKIKGNIDSNFVLVNFHWRLNDKDTPYNGINATRWIFRLTREKNCDSNLEDLQFAYFGIDKKITGIFPNFDRTLGTDFVEMPFDAVFPCYSLKAKDYSKIESFETGSQKNRKKDTEFFVLKESLFRNISQTPLEIGILQNGLYSFNNNSTKTIADYSLGCVLAEKDETVVKFKTVSNVNLLPNNSLLTPKSSGGSLDYSDHLKTCYDKKSKFSVVKVKFKDGTSWEVN